MRLSPVQCTRRHWSRRWLSDKLIFVIERNVIIIYFAYLRTIVSAVSRDILSTIDMCFKNNCCSKKILNKVLSIRKTHRWDFISSSNGKIFVESRPTHTFLSILQQSPFMDTKAISRRSHAGDVENKTRHDAKLRATRWNRAKLKRVGAWDSRRSSIDTRNVVHIAHPESTRCCFATFSLTCAILDLK